MRKSVFCVLCFFSNMSANFGFVFQKVRLIQQKTYAVAETWETKDGYQSTEKRAKAETWDRKNGSPETEKLAMAETWDTKGGAQVTETLAIAETRHTKSWAQTMKTLSIAEMGQANLSALQGFHMQVKLAPNSVTSVSTLHK